MMNQPETSKKSYSEFELNRLNFQNLCVQDCRKIIHGERFTPIIKNTLIIQETYHYFPPTETDEIHTGDICSRSLQYNTIVNAPSCDNRTTQDKSKIENITLCYEGHDQDIPMDIDLSFDSQTPALGYLDTTENMDIDMDHHSNEIKKNSRDNSGSILHNRKFKKGSIILSEKEIAEVSKRVNVKVYKKNRCRCAFIIILITLISVLLYSYLLGSGIIFDNRDVQLQNVQNDLTKSVYGQKDVVNVIIQSLKNKSHWASKIKVLSFIGSSGVGKTFVANILKKHFNRNLVHELYGNHIDFKKQWENVSNHLKHCCLNLIIIDNLNKKDTTELFTLLHSLSKNYYILVLTIFSIQYSDEKLNHFINFDDVDEIRHKFDNSDLFHELAVFHQFDDIQARDWLEKQLKVQNIEYSKTLLHDVLYDYNAAYEGFKGLHSKFLVEFQRLKSRFPNKAPHISDNSS